MHLAGRNKRTRTRPMISFQVFAAMFYAPSPMRNVWCAATFALAALTDWLDGFLARKLGVESPFGAFLDPVADKVQLMKM